MAKQSKSTCSMCGKKVNPTNKVVCGNNNFCDEFCKDWYLKTYSDKNEVKTDE